MSTFLGLIKEIPGISVDRFDGDNLNSSAYFLSHCHTDHMKGLRDNFSRLLLEYNRYLYCSPISKIFLETNHNFDTSHVKIIDIDTPTVIEYRLPDNDDYTMISVTCISAGHCPGSVMFLFERNDLLVLYTGDFRINPKDLPKLKHLHYNEGSLSLPKKIHKIYLDTTFLTRDFPFLPSRQESLSVLCNVVKEWLDKDPRNVVILECSGLYGSEFLFMELSNSLNMRIHVQDCVYKSYRRIMLLSDYVTNDPYSTRIHSCKKKFSRSALFCRNDVIETNIMTVIPSVMKWKGKDVSKVGEWDEIKERTFNVCYSTHSSCNELKAFVQYFNAPEIFPCVCPQELEDEIYDVLDEIKKQSIEETSVCNKRYTCELPSCTVLNKSFKSEYFSDDDNSI